MDLIKYFKFYRLLTKGKIFIFILLVLVGAFFELVSGGTFLAVMDFSSRNCSNPLTKGVYGIIGAMSLPSPEWELFILLSVSCIAFFLGSILIIFSAWYSAKLEAGIYVSLQQEMISKLFRAKYEYTISHNIGFLNNAIVQEMSRLSSSFKFYTSIIASGILSLTYMIYPLVLNPLLPFLMLCISFPLIYVFRLINKKTKFYSLKNTNEYGLLFGLIYQILGHFKYLKATANSPRILLKLKDQCTRLTTIIRMQALWGSISSDGFKPLIITEISVVIFFMVAIFKYNIQEVLVLMAFIYMAYQKVISVQGAYQKFISMTGTIVIYERLQKELAENDENISLSGKNKPDFSGPLSFENVTFKYSGKNEPVLKNLSLTINPKSTVAFVGGSGTGKSTIVNLICGLLHPDRGSIRLSGHDYKDLDVSFLRNSIGYVTQEPVIFNDTVANNITLWDDTLNEKMLNSSKRASADEFINEMPDKYETMLGDNGLNISGGQRQRITISRELTRNTPLIIFDEATSSLDTETERKIQKSIDEAHGERTIIIIAHRLSTIKNSDMIFVLDRGDIAESGSYDELYKRNGKFRQMVDRQSLN